MKAYLFPGQGSQRVGMGDELFDAFPEITAIADEILGFSIKELCLQDLEGRLGKTENAQPALFVVNALSYRQRLENTGELPDFVAGHSLGEYNALESAGALSFEDGLRLVRKRGVLMSTAPKGAMAAVIGITAEQVREILNQNDLSTIDIANYNAENQTIISGLEADIGTAQTSFEQHQAMYMPLNVSGAFHSRYMASALPEFSTFLRTFTFSTPEVPVIANISGRPYEGDDVAKSLEDQLTNPVRWLESMQYLLGQGVEEFVELGPGDVLKKLVRSIKTSFKAGAHGQEPPVRTAGLERPLKPVPAKPTPNRNTNDPQQVVAEWNRACPVGMEFKVNGYSQLLTSKSPAVVLFGHRAAVYMQGYNGYFALDEVEPVTQTGA